MRKIFIGLIAIIFTSSCEDVIEVEVEKGEVQLAVDAFLNDKKVEQSITLFQTKQFFDNVSQTPYVADSVYVTDDSNNKYIFEDINGDGVYTWSEIDSALVQENKTYNLTIKAGDLTYTSSSQSLAVPKIDSLNWEYVPAQLGQDNGGYAVELVARDLPGETNYYWIRFLKNGQYKNDKGSINISVDGSFNEEANNDGRLVIPPISTLVAYDVEDSVGLGDQVSYEIWSISKSTHGFWFEVSNQVIDGGIGALFATPTANVKTNIISSSPVVKNKAVGWFSVSLVSKETIIITDKPGEKLSFKIN